MVFFQELIAIPASARPVPEIGWLGVIAIAVWVAYVVAGLRSTILVGLSMLSFGIFGFWSDSMDTLIVTLLSVVFCMLVGLPVGMLMARSKAVSAAMMPVLDLMQTMPAFCYLLPLALFFGIGAAVGRGPDLHLRVAPPRADHRARHPLGLARPPSRRPGRWA